MSNHTRALSRLAGLKKRAAEIRRLWAEYHADPAAWRIEQLEEQCRRLAEADGEVSSQWAETGTMFQPRRRSDRCHHSSRT